MLGAFAVVFKVVLLLISVLMTVMILLQGGKGEGLVGLEGTRAAGVEGVASPVRRFTGVLAAAWFVVAIALAVVAGA